MAGYKKQMKKSRTKKPKEKVIKQGGTPRCGIQTGGDPDDFLSCNPVWSFANCDVDPECRWSFTKEKLMDEFWDVIFDKLRNFESMTYSDIFVKASTQNHPIDVECLNKIAQNRLEKLQIEAEALYCLRLGGKLRIYGYLEGRVYNIVWYDNNHGDNYTCVCRSKKKHT